MYVVCTQVLKRKKKKNMSFRNSLCFPAWRKQFGIIVYFGAPGIKLFLRFTHSFSISFNEEILSHRNLHQFEPRQDTLYTPKHTFIILHFFSWSWNFFLSPISLSFHTP